MGIKYNNEYVDQKIFKRSIQRLSDCNGALKKCLWKCLKENCNYIWKTSPVKIILGNQGCRRCAGNLKITSPQVDEYLSSKNIIRLQNFESAQTKISFKCIKCNFIWIAKVNSVFRQSGCPKCAKVSKLNNQLVDERIKDKKLKRIGDYINAKTKIKFKCLDTVCNFIWNANINNILYNNRGCPKCAGNLPLNNKIIDQKLLKDDRKIKRIGFCKGVHYKIKWKCLNKNCKHIWKATPNYVLNDKTGCPACPFKNQSIVYATLKSFNLLFEIQKNIQSFNSNEIKKYLIDFYIPKYNLVIEYNGEQHYQPVIFGGNFKNAQAAFVKQQKRDTYVREFLKRNKIKLIEIDGRIYTNKKLNKYVRELIINEEKLLKNNI